MKDKSQQGQLHNTGFDGDVFMAGAFKKSIDNMNDAVKSKQGQLPKTEFDERTYDFIQRYLSDHGFTGAANELKDVKKHFEFKANILQHSDN